jgi:hypothetical protein
MGLDTIPTRLDDNRIKAVWANIFRDVLIGDLVPRNVSGVATAGAGSLGDSLTQWLTAYLRTLYLTKNGFTVGFKAPSGLAGSYDLVFPSALPSGVSLPMLVDPSGIMTFEALDSNQLQDDAVTYGKRAAVNYSLASAAVTMASSVDATNQTLSNQSVTIVSTGKPLFIGMIAGSSATSRIRLFSGATGSVGESKFTLHLLKDGAAMVDLPLFNASVNGSEQEYPVSVFSHIDVGPFTSGQTYTISAKASFDVDPAASSEVKIENAQLFVCEMW